MAINLFSISLPSDCGIAASLLKTSANSPVQVTFLALVHTYTITKSVCMCLHAVLTSLSGDEERWSINIEHQSLREMVALLFIFMMMKSFVQEKVTIHIFVMLTCLICSRCYRFDSYPEIAHGNGE